MGKLETIIIKANDLPSYTKNRFEDILREIKEHYKSSQIQFVGWLGATHRVISIDGQQYKVGARQAKFGFQEIVLKETNAKNVIIPSYAVKQAATKRYRKILEEE